MSRSRPILPWVVWGTAALAYCIAVINRSSLAALGPATQEHFGIDATTLATFATLQLVVYAGLQVPVGVLLDRFGATVLILSGGVLMLTGQLVMAFVHDVPLAIAARVLVGAGDACTFISVMRLLPHWFSLRQLPILGQVTGLIGLSGQLVSVTPLALVVAQFGWATGFAGIAAIGFLVCILGFLVLRDAPGLGTPFERLTHHLGRISREARPTGPALATREIAVLEPPSTSLIPVVTPDHPSRVPGAGFVRRMRALLSLPGVRLAFWVHFTPPFALNVMALLWGTPFLTEAVGLSRSESAGLLSLMIVSSMVGSVVLGPLSSRFINRRVYLVIAVTVLIALCWITVLLWPGVPPTPLLAVLFIVTAIGGPTSMIAFEVVRSHTPRSLVGVATGFVNTGGFIATLTAILCVGFALDLQGAGSPEDYTLPVFRVALAVQVPIWAFGLTMIFIEMRRTGRWMQTHGRTLA